MNTHARTPDPKTAAAPEAPARRVSPRLTLAVVLLGYLILPMSMSGTTVAVRRIGTDLGASGAALQWVVTGYFLAASSFMLVAGSLGDMFGRRRVYRAGAIVYTLGSLGAALAAGIGMLDAARTVTGIGAAGVMASGGAILATTFEGPARTRAFAAMGTTSGIGLSLGPTVAGWLVGSLGWRGTFGLFGAAGLLLIAGTWVIADVRTAARPRIDLPGIATFISGLALVMFAVTQGAQAGWGSARVLLPGVAGAVLLAVFAAVERRSAHPMLNLALLADRRFSGWLLAGLAATVAFGGMLANLPNYLQGVNGLSSGEAGLVMMLPTAPVLLLPTVGGRLVTRGLPPRLLVTAALLAMAAGNAWLTVLHPGVGVAQLAGPLLLIGAGLGLTAGVIDGQAMAAVAPERAGMATGLLNTVRGSSQALTMALFGSALITLLQRDLGSAQLAGKVATGNLTGGTAGQDLPGALTDAWQIVLTAIAAVVGLAALAVRTLLRGTAAGPDAEPEPESATPPPAASESGNSAPDSPASAVDATPARRPLAAAGSRP